jgi:hypothetical protein
VLKLAPYYGIGLLLLSTQLSTMVARTLPIWYDLQHQPSTITSLVGTWCNINLVPVIFLVAIFCDLAKNTFQWIFCCKFPSSQKNHQETIKFEISPKITTTASNMKVCLRFFKIIIV